MSHLELQMLPGASIIMRHVCPRGKKDAGISWIYQAAKAKEMAS